MEELKIGELVLYMSDEYLPCIGIVSSLVKGHAVINTIPGFSERTYSTKNLYKIDYINELIKKGG